MGRRNIPNLLTALRIVLGVFVFAGLAAAAGAPPFPAQPSGATAQALIVTSLIAFIVAALTDYLDGYLARLWKVSSPWGAMLDPIADKIAVAAAIVGLALLIPATAAPGFVILFREMFVSGMREAGGARGLKFPVTQLAKWKTAAQLVALSLAIGAVIVPQVIVPALVLLWIAAALTLWTGWGYAMAANRGLKGL
ncbi:CDP-diacylglycerol--glycerol-3-phosphate 3-phosphatidyltransferase [soil metagenome]